MLKQLYTSLFLVSFIGTAMAVEEPKYQVLEKSEQFELRAYEPKIIAETVISGSLDEASSKGFKLIADYIFGNNTAANGQQENISMTAPVTMEAQSEKIAMTAPVTMEKSEGQWRMHFVMPSEYTMQTIPKPNNTAVKLRQIPARNYAVIEFSGFASEAKIAKKTQALFDWLNKKGITPKGKAELARYNPPWTLPFLRRNEIIVAY